MSSCVYVFNAPPISFSRTNLYSKDFSFETTGSYIKAISDSFFLSNDFRKNNVLYYCTQYNEEPITIIFDGKTIRYLGPSFFSAAHLLLRAKNHIDNPNSKSGKLTPGLTVYKQPSEWVLEKFVEKEMIRIQMSSRAITKNQLESCSDSNVFLFGFEKLPLKYHQTEIQMGPLAIDEQVIILNYFMDQVV